ncbi:hypothetical protein FRC17_008289 [Serendipita sp. 399]|nr:hypothetical protein FRC17_008289 [Serendipita sp. 399]
MLFLGGIQDEIVPHEHMVTLWNIAIGKLNPDGTSSSSIMSTSAPTSSSSQQRHIGDDDGGDLLRRQEEKAEEEGVTSTKPVPGPPLAISSSSSAKATPRNSGQDAALDKETTMNDDDDRSDIDADEETREEVEYEIVDDQRVVVSKRTKYRIWRQFEKGTHNDTCVQPGYWAAIWEFINSLVPLPAEHFTSVSSSTS